MKPIVPHLWFTTGADEAARFYVSIFPNSRVDRVTPAPSDTPSGPAGSVVIVDFTLNGHPFQALTAGPLDPFNHAVSFVVPCETQEEIDRYWHALLEGGQAEECGWLRDKYGLAWQIVPVVLDELIASSDTAAAKRAMDAMLKMVKLNIEALERAYRGE
ncbi:MAG: VOC family protein [Acidobacteria bacterium]|nr:VOC family protein [Acidobacteriota bacterium]